ncbi:hypothetical protein ACFQ3P_04515 [Paraburkholderia sabiae]|uniref:Uncharacterized protein n=1 Tax=Paraburkholderia sabiae TaxID=273251 RepID=A0ABU9QMF6_9BURK|nr:hypothetical protein [Paraburkholderia sabiae]WJZ79128.1 hypothetical protein QEN71_34720 [Paraburkholderia sabiae]CAD6514379.1 hypothetical protein LMG24235_00905 [Paraburkholderia sabiae]
MFNRVLFVSIAAALPALVAAAPSPIKVRTVTYGGSLPYVESDDARRDARINNQVFLDMAEQPAPARYPGKIEEPKVHDGPPQDISDFSFSVLRNDDRILALEVDAEGCGAYCEQYSRQYNFDAATGRALFASDLFAPAGGTALLRQNLAERLTEYRRAIASLNRDAVANRKKNGIATPWPQPRLDGKQDQEEERVASTVSMYERCMEPMQSPDYAKYYTLANTSLEIGRESVTFVYGRCSNHAELALDDVGDQKVAYRIADLAPYFSAYGKYLLMSGPQQAAPPTEPYQQILQGRVGQAAITLRLSEHYGDDSLSGSYFYDKYREPIALNGKVNGNVIELTEYESSDTPKPLIRATIRSDRLEGQWIGKRTLDFRAAP